MKSPTNSPTYAPTNRPMNIFTISLTNSSMNTFMNSPVNAPTNSCKNSPMNSRTNSLMNSPMNSPIDSAVNVRYVAQCLKRLYLLLLWRKSSEIWPRDSKLSCKYSIKMLTFSQFKRLRNLNFWKAHTLPSIRTLGPVSDRGNTQTQATYTCLYLQNPSDIYLSSEITQIVRGSNRK